MPNRPLIVWHRTSSLAHWAMRENCKAPVENDLKALKTHRIAWLEGALLLLFSATALANTQAILADEPLGPENRHEDIGELITQFIQKSHYRHVTVNDDLSSDVMDRYIEALDRNRMYLLASDIEFFEQYRYQLDDVVRSQPLDPVYDMFSVYRTRVRALSDTHPASAPADGPDPTACHSFPHLARQSSPDHGAPE